MNWLARNMPARQSVGRSARARSRPARFDQGRHRRHLLLQQILTRPEEFDVIATLTLNGDYMSDALAAQVGGIGIAPGGNINYVTGHAVFEATHAPRRNTPTWTRSIPAR